MLLVLNRFQKIALSAVYTETMRFHKVAFSNNSTLESVFKTLRCHSQIFRFHLDSKLNTKIKLRFLLKTYSCRRGLRLITYILLFSVFK